MTYEKDGVTIDVTKAMWNGAQVVIALTKGDQTQDIRAGKEPHSDFKAALTNLRPIFLRHMELDSYPDIEKRIMITRSSAVRQSRLPSASIRQRSLCQMRASSRLRMTMAGQSTILMIISTSSMPGRSMI